MRAWRSAVAALERAQSRGAEARALCKLFLSKPRGDAQCTELLAKECRRASIRTRKMTRVSHGREEIGWLLRCAGAPARPCCPRVVAAMGDVPLWWTRRDANLKVLDAAARTCWRLSSGATGHRARAN